MSHWFDDLTRQLALGKLSRRDALIGTLQAGLGAAAGWFGPLDALAQIAPDAPVTAPPRGGPCTVIRSGERSTFQLSVRSKLSGKPITLFRITTITRTPRIPGRGGPQITSTETVTLGSDVVLHTNRTTSRGSTQLKVSYGSAFQGIKESSFTTDGKLVEGEIDGRRIVPLPVGAHAGSIKFEDGKPAPVVIVDQSLRQAITSLFEQARQAASSCEASGGIAPALPLITGGDACNSCNDKCTRDGLICDGGVAAACVLALFGYGVCVAAGAAACAAAFGACESDCDSPGNACCPVSCPGDNCCDNGESCADQNIDPKHTICCPKLQIVCSGVCCAPGILQCNQGTCCPSNHSVCSGVCCAAGQACSTENICCATHQPGVTPISCHGVCCLADEVCRAEGVCCPPGAPVCKGVCCRSGQCDSNGECCSLGVNGGNLCGGTCCPVFSKCCNNVCCDSFDQCVNGTCCPPAQVCGGICCPPGQGCQNHTTQTCGACAAGLVTCVPLNSSPNVCCPPGISCCAGNCCPPGQICCDIAGVFGCHTEQVCIP